MRTGWIFVVFLASWLPLPVWMYVYPNCYSSSYRYDQNSRKTEICEMINTIYDPKTDFSFPSSSWTELKCTNCSLEMIPVGIFKNNHQVRILSLAHSGIKSLSVRDFTDAENLQTLNATGNSIQSLESYLFVRAVKLTAIDLSFNAISVISEYTFADNVLLESIALNDNQLIAFSTILPQSLKSLFLQNNRLMSLNHVDSLNLMEIDLSNNTQLQLDTQPDVSILKLSHTTQTVCIILADSTLAIDLADNHVEAVLIEGYATPIIKELHLQRNRLTSVANLTGLLFLEVLDVSSNLITDIALSTFAKMVELRTLRLMDSGLKRLAFGQFSQQTRLVELDISYNRFGQLDLGQLTLLTTLTSLYIDGNDLREIDETEAKHLALRLSHIGLADNQFNCTFLVRLSQIFAHKIVVDHTTSNLNESNVHGMACQTKSDLSANQTWSLDEPIVRMSSNHSQAYAEIEARLASITENVRKMGNKGEDEEQSHRGELLELRQSIASLRNDLDERLISLKSSILVSVADLLNINDNQTRNGTDLGSTSDKLNQANIINRFRLLAQFVEAIANGMDVNPGALVQRQHLVSRDMEDTASTSSSRWFVVCVVFLVFNGGLVVYFVMRRLGYSCGRSMEPRRSTSSNTVMTSC